MAIEGIDGAGKDTLAVGLAGRLREAGMDVVVTKEPTDGPIGEVIRREILRGSLSDPRIAALLFAADRVWHYENVIRPGLSAGKTVVTVRYVESSVAYQGAAGLPIEWIEAINPVPRPHLTILLDLPVEEALRRLAARGSTDHMERAPLLARAREIYLARAGKIGAVVLDATRPPDELVEKALAAVLARCRSA